MKKNKKSHGVQLLIRAIVTDPDGKVISDTGRKSSHSFLIQFLEFFYGIFRGTEFSATETSGAEGVIYDPTTGNVDNLRVSSAVAEDMIGVVIGTGDTAETNEDYKLETRLTEGTTAGQITYNECTVETVAVVGANVDVEITRSFTNGTGSTITVKEAGIYSYTRTNNWHCLVRDVLLATIDVPDKCGLSIIYTMRTTV